LRVIVQKFWSAFMAQINKIANVFWQADPIAQMQYEYDRAVDELKEGRTGLEQYRGLVERVNRQVAANRSHVQKLEAETKAYLKAGDRPTATTCARSSTPTANWSSCARRSRSTTPSSR
jgi:phage shock protein A